MGTTATRSQSLLSPTCALKVDFPLDVGLPVALNVYASSDPEADISPDAGLRHELGGVLRRRGQYSSRYYLTTCCAWVASDDGTGWFDCDVSVSVHGEWFGLG